VYYDIYVYSYIQQYVYITKTNERISKMDSVLPLYYQIKHVIKTWITNKEFGPGQKIPSEMELAEKFQVSRLTIRQAIAQLVQEGFLKRERGEGTFVTEDKNLINGYSFETSGLMDNVFFHQLSEIKVKHVEINRIVSTNWIREKLGLSDADREVIQIKRLRQLREGLPVFTINYFSVEIGSQITEEALYGKLITEILEKDLGIRFTEAVQTIEATFANSEVAEKIGVPSGAPLLSIERVMFGQKRTPVELFQSFCRGDLFKYIVRFKYVRGEFGRKWVHTSD
jgi:GntR family transcriptional regulator